MEREILDLLILARAHLEFGWCQGAYALDGKGSPCYERDLAAVRWCLTGAMQAAFLEVGGPRPVQALEGAWQLLHTESPSPVDYNDSHGQQDVLALIDRAAARLGSG